MAKVLIAIASDSYVRNYLTTSAFSALEEEFECHFIADQNLSSKELLEEKPGFRGFFGISDAVERKTNLLFNLMMWRYRSKSPTFLYRWLRNSQWHLIDKSHGLQTYLISVIRWFISAAMNPQGLVIPLLGNRLVFPLASRALQHQIPINKGLELLVREQDYDLVIFPSSAIDTLSVELTRICQRLAVPSLCLIDNWDNLSSKSVFWTKPDHIAVWGPQARDQALKIHSFEPDRIHEIGTPRFDQYFAARAKPRDARIYDFPYVLFVGSAMPFDEIAALKLIEDSILNSVGFPKKVKIVYRPHPWQQKRNVRAEFIPSEFERVQLDRQMTEASPASLDNRKKMEQFQPDLDYYPSLLMNAIGVVGPLTTMLLEAALCLRPVVALNYFDGIHGNTTRRYFSHFEGAEKIPGFAFCNETQSLPKLLKSMLNNRGIPEKQSDRATRYFLNRTDEPYSRRLATLVQFVVAQR